jgi:hypothetical protein
VALNGRLNRVFNPHWHDKKFELCVSLLTGHMTWAICLKSRNTSVMHCEELISTEYVAMAL